MEELVLCSSYHFTKSFFDIDRSIRYGFDVLLPNLLVKLKTGLRYDECAEYRLIKISLASHFNQMFQMVYDYCVSNTSSSTLPKFIKYTVQGAMRANDIRALQYIASKEINLENFISPSDYEDINDTLAIFLSEKGIILPASLYLNKLDSRNRFKGFNSLIKDINNVFACDFK